MSFRPRAALRAAAVFACAAAAAGIGQLAWLGGFGDRPWDWIWLALVWSPAAAAFVAGGASWALVARSPGRPGMGVGALAGLLSVTLGYVLHGIVAAVLLAGLGAFRLPEPGVKEQGSIVFFTSILYMVSVVWFVPAAVLTGAVLGTVGGRSATSSA
jgi:hypothetical protein